jgi:hypothetical protein
MSRGRRTSNANSRSAVILGFGRHAGVESSRRSACLPVSRAFEGVARPDLEDLIQIKFQKWKSSFSIEIRVLRNYSNYIYKIYNGKAGKADRSVQRR